MAARLSVVLGVIFAAAGFVWAQEQDQPLKRAKVGDYVIFKMDSGSVKGTMKQEVTAVDGTKVTVRTITTLNEMELKPDVKTVDYAQKVDPEIEAQNRKKNGIVDTGKGEQTLKINGKEYRCNWTSNKTTVSANGMEIVTEAKVWISKDAPVYGLVKSESTVFGMATVMELTEAGSKK